MGAQGHTTVSKDLEEVKYIPSSNENSTELKPKDKIEKSDTLFLYFTILTGIIPIFIGGATLVWTSPALVKLMSNDINENPLGRPISTLEITILFGIPRMVSLLTLILAPTLSDFLGLKKYVYTIGFVMFFSILGLAFSKDVYTMAIFYTLLDNSFAGADVILPVYLTEICEDHNRAKYNCIMATVFPLGQLYAYLVGARFSLKIFTLLIAAPLIPFLILFFYAPESPVYSLSKENSRECMNTIQKLRNNKNSNELQDDLIKIKQTLAIANDKKGFRIVKLFSSKSNRIGFACALLPMLTLFCSGVPILMGLLGPTFNQFGSNLSGNTIAILVGSIKVIMYTTTSFIIEKFGKKPLLIASTAGSGIAISTLGGLFYLNHLNSPVIRQFPWIPLVCVVLVFISYSLGIGPIPYTVMAELFPPELRSTAAVVVSTTTRVVFSIYATSYPTLQTTIGTHGCLWIFGATCFLAMFLVYFFLPETKGKSVVEIQSILKNYRVFSK